MTQRPGLALDWALLLVVVGLLLFSLALVYSASAAVGVWKFGSSQYFLERHAVRVGLSIVLLLVCAWVDYRHWQRLSGLLLWIGIGLLLLVLVLGEPVKGAARWLQIGPLRFQPSEYIKFALLLHMARLLAQEPVARRPPSAKRPLLWLLLCCALIAAQPNASVAVLLALVGMLLLLSGGVRWTTLSGVALLGVLALGVYLVAAPYRMARLASFFEGETLPYQARQALLAFGHGGILGVGPGQSVQRELFLPEAYGDFVFAIVGEEYGIVGTTVVILAFAVLLWRGMRVAQRAPDAFGFLLALGITATFGLYAVVHMAVTTGLLPVTGIPLPFVSYGGSSIFFSAAAAGVLLNIGRQAQMPRWQEALPGVVLPRSR
ncbi:MAG: putative peptidoglycan glycosyltransferase FtsW [Chlorobiota bacterium]|jgi:cell division protein FtsW|nr:putative peptidoglycan glycosyltransferase FtsW [Chlorobiota bacterium]